MKLNDKEIKAKIHALQSLMEEANGMEGDDLEHDFKGLKKVTIASDSQDGLNEGLEKAADLIKEPSESLDEEMMKLDSDEDEMKLPDPSKDDSDLALEEDEDLKKPLKGLIKSKKPKLSFFE